jgi:sorbose reductase
MDQFSLKGQTALLTGAARGLGLAFAESLASAGANIAVLDVIEPEQGLFDIRAKYGVKVEFYNCNVTDRAAVNETVERVEREFGAIHIW